MRSYVEQGVVDRIRSAGGEIYAISSEPQQLADRAHDDWALDFENVGDPHQEISRTCSERGWLTLYANQGSLAFLQRGASWKIEHPKGYFQPGVLAVTREGRVLYRWRSVPSAENMQGTLARPTARHAWGAIERALEAGGAIGDAALDDDPEVDSKPAPRPLFIAALLANGWFLRVKSLVYSPGAKTGAQRFPALLARWLLFFAFWAVAFALLPIPPVALAFAGWILWVRRDIRRMLGGASVQKELVPER